MSNKNNPQNLDFQKIIDTPEFKALSKKKNAFLTPYVAFASIAYGVLPFLTAYTTILENHAIGYITWTWIYAFGLFAMVFLFSTIYTRKATTFDVDAQAILDKHVVNTNKGG